MQAKRRISLPAHGQRVPDRQVRPDAQRGTAHVPHRQYGIRGDHLAKRGGRHAHRGPTLLPGTLLRRQVDAYRPEPRRGRAHHRVRRHRLLHPPGRRAPAETRAVEKRLPLHAGTLSRRGAPLCPAGTGRAGMAGR